MAADGSIVIQTDLDDKKAQAELNRLAKKIDDLNAKIKQAETDRLPWLEQAEQLGVKLDEAKAKLEAMRAAPAGTYTAEQIAEQAETVKSLQAQWDAAQKKVEGYDRAIERSKSQLNAAEERAGELSKQLSGAGDAGEKAGGQISAAMEAAQKRLEKFEKRVVGLVKRVFVFTLITKALRSLKDYLWQNIQQSEQARAAIARLKGALLTLAQPLVNVIIPAFTKLVELLAKVAATAARIVSKLFGQTVETTAAQAEAAYNASKGLKDESKALKNTAKAAKEAEKQLADFDEIQKLTSDTAEDTSDLLNADAGADTGTAPDFKSVIDEQLSAIIELFAGAALLALGAILTFSGANIPLGIALMVIGALAIWDAISENKEAIIQWIKDHSAAIALALVAAAAVALVVGIILILTGHILVGIGLIVLGIALFAAAAALNKDAIIQFIKDHSDTIAIALLAAAAIAVVVGIVLLVAGKILLGIALIVIGIALYVAATELDKGAVQQFIQEHSDAIAVALLALAAIAVMVGIVLLFTPKFLLGIALIILGIAMFVQAFQMSNEVRSWVQEHMQQITTALLAAAAVAVIIGIVLLFTPHFLIGIGLILVGIALFAAAVQINDELSRWIEDNMSKIAAVVGAISAALVVIGIILLFTGAGIPLGLGLILAGIVGLNWAQSKDPDWDWLKEKLSEVWDKIAEAAKTAWEALKKFFSDTWEKIKDIFADAGDKIKEGLDDAWDKIKKGVTEAWDAVKKTITGKIDEIKKAISEFVESMKKKIQELIDKLKSVGSSIGSGIKSFFGGGSSASSVAGTYGISTASIPGLARGAVIPPNREFLAVLGDQRSGNNVEAPESLLQSMADRAASANTELLREILRAIQAGQVIEFERQPFGQVVRDVYNTESSRVGTPLVTVT